MTRVPAAVTEPIWRPSEQRIAESNLRRFIAAVRDDLPGDDYAALYEWSIARPADFWAALWKFCRVRAVTDWKTVLAEGTRMPGARWFEGATLSFAANLLHPEFVAPAIVFVNERGERMELSAAQLARQVASVAAGLKALGVVPGDRVAGFVANRPEAVVAMLAAASLGAIWSSCSPDFGAAAVIDRFGQIAPKSCSPRTVTSTTARASTRCPSCAASPRSCPSCVPSS
jgi:acetoacetyl-CoA synthetase